MQHEEIEALLSQYGYACHNDLARDCPKNCPLRILTADIFAEALKNTGKNLSDLETLLYDRKKLLEHLARLKEGRAQGNFEDVVTSAIVQVASMIVREEVREGKRKPCALYPDVAIRKPRRRRV